jgi:hypothetical protein
MRREAHCVAVIAVAQTCAVKGAPLRGRAKLALDRAARRQGNVYGEWGGLRFRPSWTSYLWLGAAIVAGRTRRAVRRGDQVLDEVT